MWKWKLIRQRHVCTSLIPTVHNTEHFKRWMCFFIPAILVNYSLLAGQLGALKFPPATTSKKWFSHAFLSPQSQLFMQFHVNQWEISLWICKLRCYSLISSSDIPAVLINTVILYLFLQYNPPSPSSHAAHSSRKWYSSDKMLPKWSQDSQGGTTQGKHTHTYKHINGCTWTTVFLTGETFISLTCCVFVLHRHWWWKWSVLSAQWLVVLLLER